MIHKNTDMYTLLKKKNDKRLLCFGAGRLLKRACDEFNNIKLFENIDFIADNNKDIKTFNFNGTAKEVHSIDNCIKIADKELIILITVIDFANILKQLDRIPALNNCECYLYALVCDCVKPYRLPKNRALNESIVIPKTIHYCWFGNSPIPSDFSRNIETWKKYCPDYEIVRWDESNYDYKKNKYMYEAYKNKSWGFVPDYARLDIIYNYGGIYLDTDVELIKNIDDLLCDEAFCGFESANYIANGLGFGAIPGFDMLRAQMNIYDDLCFLDEFGIPDLTPAPVRQTQFFISEGLITNNIIQNINGMIVYPSDVLSPLSNRTWLLNITENTYAIHHYAGTWFDNTLQENRKRNIEKKTKLWKLFFAS